MIASEDYLEQLTNRLGDVYFIEIGAMDGKSFDLLHPFILQYQWHGILVEPLADMFAQLQQTYKDCDHLVFENVAIAESAEDREISRVSMEAVNARLVPGWAKGIASLYEDRNAIGGMNGLLYGRKMPKKNYAVLRQHIKKEKVNCMTLQQLLKKNNVSKIDVLQIDTEGYDYKIFRQFDFNTYLPYFVKVEVGNLPQQEYKEILHVLQSHQYSCQLDNLDLYGQLPLPSME